MKLYFSKGACSLAVRIILNELNLTFQEEAVNLKDKKTQSGKDFLTINSKGSVPVIELDNGEILTENAVILQYLADSEKAMRLLPMVGDFKRYRVLEVLNFITTELHKGCGPLFNPTIPAEIKEQIFKPLVKTKLTWIGKRLEKQNYLMGDEFSLPDAYLFVILFWMPSLKIDISDLTHLNQYFKRLSEYPSIQKSLVQEGFVSATTTG